MFTGIIEDLGKINKLVSLNGGLEITVNTSLAQDLEVDDSLCINGVCQTVIARDKQSITVQAVEETLRKTTFDELVVADSVNLERALSLNTRIDGHIIQGHVDTTGTIKKIEREGTNWLITIQYPNSFKDLIVGRGSIAVDGISLTVAREQGNEFSIAIIPFTLTHTNLKNKEKGDKVNLEFDIIGKYIQRYMQNRDHG